jgi:hypothetical protein
MSNYRDYAEQDAKATVENFIDQIVEQLCDNGKASDDLLNDYPGGDTWHHENHIDHCYDFKEAAAIIDQLSEFEEADRGLWEGQDMKEAVSTCAAFTYGNAVYHEWCELIKRINQEADAIIYDFEDKEAELESDIDNAYAEAEDREEEAEKDGLSDNELDELNELADDARSEADEKQAALDSLPDQKAEALRELIAGMSS